MMEGLKLFLNSSSIHGLGHISSSKRFSRLFWIIVVITGFSIAGYLINQSFQSWSQQPIVTTIETLPADEMKLPKVTVCPPKNSFTDLNYDLMLAKNVSLTIEMLDELSTFAEYAIDIDYLKYLSKVEDKDLFYNWYKGISPMELPTLEKQKKSTSPTKLCYTLKSSGLSGNVKTQYFKEKFDIDLVERSVDYQVQISIPDYLKNDENITIYIKFEWVCPEKSWIRMSSVQQPLLKILDGYREYSLNLKHDLHYTDTIYVSYRYNKLIEEDLQMDYIPGFKLIWYYSGKGLKSSTKPASFDPGTLTNSFKRGVATRSARSPKLAFT